MDLETILSQLRKTLPHAYKLPGCEKFNKDGDGWSVTEFISKTESYTPSPSPYSYLLPKQNKLPDITYDTIEELSHKIRIRNENGIVMVYLNQHMSCRNNREYRVPFVNSKVLPLKIHTTKETGNLAYSCAYVKTLVNNNGNFIIKNDHENSILEIHQPTQCKNAFYTRTIKYVSTYYLVDNYWKIIVYGEKSPESCDKMYIPIYDRDDEKLQHYLENPNDKATIDLYHRTIKYEETNFGNVIDAILTTENITTPEKARYTVEYYNKEIVHSEFMTEVIACIRIVNRSTRKTSEIIVENTTDPIIDVVNHIKIIASDNYLIYFLSEELLNNMEKWRTIMRDYPLYYLELKGGNGEFLKYPNMNKKSEEEATKELIYGIYKIDKYNNRKTQ